ncbi:MAG: RimK/LysX family protein [Bacteroidota bacterium]
MADRFILGWEEWLSLPDLGLPAIKTKVDTGAKTSALHAFTIEAFGPPSRPMVRFGVHPIPGRDDVEVFCTAPVIDRREVTSSNGERELRYVIETRVKMADREWPIEVTLTNRETMSYRMLLGRQAIADDMFVDPTSSFRQPRLGYKVYGPRGRNNEERRSLRIALLTRRPESPSNRRLIRAIEGRGHTPITIDRTRVSLFVDTMQPAIFVDGQSLEAIDAVIVRAGRPTSSFSAAILRQLEMLGALALNPADALARAVDQLALRQRLARSGVPVPEAAVSHAASKQHGGGPEGLILADNLGLSGFGPLLRFAVVGGRAIAAMEQDIASRDSLEAEAPRWQPHRGAAADPAQRLAEQAARALELGIASVDIIVTRQGPIVTDVSTSIAIALFERITGAAVAAAIVVEIEQAAKSPGRRAAQASR